MVWGGSAGNAFFHSQIIKFVRHSQQINVTGPELQDQNGWLKLQLMEMNLLLTGEGCPGSGHRPLRKGRTWRMPHSWAGSALHYPLRNRAASAHCLSTVALFNNSLEARCSDTYL